MSDRLRRCDAACTNARRQKCNCFCRGLFHGLAAQPPRPWTYEAEKVWNALVAEVGQDEAFEITRNERAFYVRAPAWLRALHAARQEDSDEMDQ